MTGTLMQKVNSYCTNCKQRSDWERIGEMDSWDNGIRYHLYTCEKCETSKFLKTLLEELK